VAFNKHHVGLERRLEGLPVPVECLPIPYTLTDFGRAYLALLRATEEAEVLAASAHSNIGTPPRRAAARPKRSR
jgi:hypothetical protein